MCNIHERPFPVAFAMNDPHWSKKESAPVSPRPFTITKGEGALGSHGGAHSLLLASHELSESHVLPDLHFLRGNAEVTQKDGAPRKHLCWKTASQVNLEDNKGWNFLVLLLKISVWLWVIPPKYADIKNLPKPVPDA